MTPGSLLPMWDSPDHQTQISRGLHPLSVPPPCARPVPARTCSLAPVDERQRAVIVGVAALAPSSTVQAHLGASAKRSHGTEYRIHPCPTPQWAQTFRALSPDTVLNQKVTRMA